MSDNFTQSLKFCFPKLLFFIQNSKRTKSPCLITFYFICILLEETVAKYLRGSFKKLPDCFHYFNVSCRIQIEIICEER